MLRCFFLVIQGKLLRIKLSKAEAFLQGERTIHQLDESIRQEYIKNRVLIGMEVHCGPALRPERIIPVYIPLDTDGQHVDVRAIESHLERLDRQIRNRGAAKWYSSRLSKRWPLNWKHQLAVAIDISWDYVDFVWQYQFEPVP